jgi:cell division protein FtsW (lipid II flippase)
VAVTRSKTVERQRQQPLSNSAPAAEWRWLAPASILIAAGLFLVFQAKSQRFPEFESALNNKQLLNLSELSSREDLLPFLTIFPSAAERQFVARKIYYAAGSLPNVGAIAAIRVSAPEVSGVRQLSSFRERLSQVKTPAGHEPSIPLLTTAQFRLLKPLFVVRRPAAFKRSLLLCSGLFFIAFAAVVGWWSSRDFRGDRLLLIPVLLLCGAGLILMISLRDPLRDRMIFVEFAQGVVAGCLLLAALSAVDYRRLFGNLSYIPLLGSFTLSFLLLAFGYGPGVSDAKVNLFGFQPIELIRILLILFLAGYFAPRWHVLRHATESRPSVAWLAMNVNLPPLEASVPVLACVALSLLFFFLQKDLGPALVFACLFLALYAIARNSVVLVAAGLALLIAGFAAGYYLGVPETVGARVSMWLSPWDNAVRGGDQLAHSLWSFATGGVVGSGLGLGEPALIPAGHTDLVLSALGEEWGFLGLVGIFGLYAVILYRSFRIAMNAATDYEVFLAAGLSTAVALQLLLIAAGALGAMPLSGVVTPFLSYGRTSMLANFIVVAMLLSISRNARAPSPSRPFRTPLIALGLLLGACGAILTARAFDVQVYRGDRVAGQPSLVFQADGARRYQYNPRFLDIIREIPRGAIYDRNGLPLATSRWQELEVHRAGYTALGIDLDHAVSRTNSRYYPLGAVTYNLLGDLATQAGWAAPNTSFVERDSARQLRGYDDRPSVVQVANPKPGEVERTIRYDYRELVPILRHRHDPDNPALRRILDRPRDVRLSIDARLQVKMQQLLERQLRQTGKEKGALVVLEPQSGDLLAAVSAPEIISPTPYLDRARYGLYPPGSTFKVVTAMAALSANPDLGHKTYTCQRLPDGRVGAFLRGSNRPIRDDVLDTTPHGSIDMERAITVSCNAYFAQLGTYDVGAAKLLEIANLFGIAAAAPNTAEQLRRSLPQASYGQGQVVASPLQMARVAAAIAQPANALLGKYMREVVTAGTGRRAAGAVEPIAGKTGTAELANAPSHAWFIGFAPYGKPGKKIAFSILIENGQYGGAYAAAATEIVSTARELGLIAGEEAR